MAACNSTPSEPRLAGIPARLDELLDGLGDIGLRHLGNGMGQETGGREHVPGSGHRGRAQQLRPGPEIGGMADAPGVHELNEDPAALLMDGLGDRAPARHLGFREDARNVQVARWGEGEVPSVMMRPAPARWA